MSEIKRLPAQGIFELLENRMQIHWGVLIDACFIKVTKLSFYEYGI